MERLGRAAVRINSDNYTSQIIAAKLTKNLQRGDERARRGAAIGDKLENIRV